MTVKKNILPAIKNKTASPIKLSVAKSAFGGAKPPLLPILLTSLGEAASTTKNSKLKTQNFSLMPFLFYSIRHFQKVKNKWDKWDKWDSGVSLPTICCLLSRYKTPVAGWSG